MKVELLGKIPHMLEETLRVQGETIQEGEVILDGGDLVARDGTIGGSAILSSTIFDLSEADVRDKDFELVKWWDQGQGFRDFTLIAFPMVGTWSQGLGYPALLGYSARYVIPVKIDSFFNSEVLHSFLNHSKYNGPVSALFSFEEALEGVRFLGVNTGFQMHLFNLLEGVSGRLMDFFMGVCLSPKESWTISLHLSVFPWPYEDKEAIVEGLHRRDVSRHFYKFEGRREKDLWITKQGEVGVASAWSPNLNDAGSRVLRTMENIKLSRKQYRTDIVPVTKRLWRRVVDLGLVYRPSS